MAIISADKDTFKKEVLESNNKVLVDFNAEWCGPCRMLKPVLEELSDNSEYKIVSVNVDSENELSEEYNVYSIPCLVLFENGKEINRAVGFMPKEEVEKFIGGK